MAERSKGYEHLFDLSGKTAVVTGATGLLGRHFCHGLASFGADVAIVDLEQEVTERFAEEIGQQYGVRALGVACDVADPKAVEAMVEQVSRYFGAIHILHNNAATKSTDLEAFFRPFESYALSAWREIMAVNIDGMFLVAQAVGNRMIAQETGGSIIQTASIYGVLGADKRIYEGSFYLGQEINTPGVYAASKGAVVALTRYLATYWADKGIRVNAIAPGGIESGQNAEFMDRYSARIPLGRMGKPSEMVGALILLASDASRYMTGQTLMIDGGLSAW